VRVEETIIDLRLSTSLDSFKRHLLSSVKLSPNQFDRYLLYGTLPALKQGGTEKMMALANDLDLKSVVLQTVMLKRKLVFKLQKFITVQARSKKKTETKAKNVIEFDETGQVVRDKLQVLQERPRYKIYSVESEL